MAHKNGRFKVLAAYGLPVAAWRDKMRYPKRLAAIKGSNRPFCWLSGTLNRVDG